MIRSTIQILILVIVIAIVTLLLAAILRRVTNKRRYFRLDRERDFFRQKISQFLQLNMSINLSGAFFGPTSFQWQALEDVLFEFMESVNHRQLIKPKFLALGYVSFYEKQLTSRNPIVRASAADKLGRMQSDSSADKIIVLLDDESAEVVTVAIRALSKIGSRNALRTILERLPGLLKKGFVSQKAVELSIPNFGGDTASVLLDYGRTCENPEIIASILEVLFHMRTTEALAFASDHVHHRNAEVRAKALKLIASLAEDLVDFDATRLAPCLADPVWFVRLHAAKALGNTRHKNGPDMLSKLLLDEKWQVRDAAAVALTRMGDASIGIFLDTLKGNDRYAKEAICEEIEKTRFVDKLIENLVSPVRQYHEKSIAILTIMASLGFVTPLLDYIAEGPSYAIKTRIRSILQTVP
jgi:HEAT repeat protein